MIETSLNTQTNAQNSFGAMLKQARKAKQVSLEEASATLFILKRHLQALEDEDFSELPQVAFSRGFAINYAKFLDLDPNKVATAFDAAYPNELKARSTNNTESLLQPMGTLQRDNHSRIRVNPLLIIAVIALIILAIFLFRMVSNASRDNEGATPVSEEVSASEQIQGAAINTSSEGISASGSALNLGAETQGTATLNIKVSKASEISITDVSGNSLMSGEQALGNYTLVGTPPFSIQIENIKDVSLLLNSAPIKLEAYATGNQAVFELAP